MEKLEFFLNYQDEKEFIKDEYRIALKNICSENGKIFEANSEEDFRSGRLIENDYLAFPMWKEDVEKIDDYFGDIVKWFMDTDQGKEASRENGLDQLEHWMTVKSCKISDKNIFIMAPCHPVVKLLDDDSKRIREKYNRSVKNDSSSISRFIKKSVVEDYLCERERFYVYGTGQVYLSKRADGCRRAIPWEDVGTLTSLDSLRLLEKTISWVRRNEKGTVVTKDAKRDVSIAYIGTIDNPESLQDYFDKNQILIHVSLTQLVKIPQRKYVFMLAGDVSDEKRMFDLSSLADMKALFERYDIVLFMDESYFYRQEQVQKSLSEKGAVEYVQWCQRMLEWELRSKHFSEDEAKGRKSHFYREIYNKAGLWMNGYGKDMTARFSFDRDLFSTIEQAAASVECDVYLYISLGETIGDIDLSRQSVCNDERYDGKQLLVYKAASSRQNDTVDSAVIMMLQDKKADDSGVKNQQSDNILAEIDLWKLIKSIGRKFSDYFFASQDVSKEDSYKVINLLRQSYLLVHMSESCGKETQLFFSLYLCDGLTDQEYRRYLKCFVESFLKICKAEADIPYVKNYLYDLLVNAILSRSNSVKGIFYAYLMEQKRVVINEEINDMQNYKKQNKTIMFQARRAVYSAIKGLDQIVVRDMEKRWDILQYEFRNLYCRDIMEHTFTTLLGQINEYCEEAGYTDSKLYLLTEPERNIYEK
jgi:hypothetical protein